MASAKRTIEIKATALGIFRENFMALGKFCEVRTAEGDQRDARS
jgi:hypothetical protein